MWIRVSRHRVLSLDSARADHLQMKPITHSDCFALFIKCKEEQMVNLGEDLDKAEAIFDAVWRALDEGRKTFDLQPLLD